MPSYLEQSPVQSTSKILGVKNLGVESFTNAQPNNIQSRLTNSIRNLISAKS